MVNLDITELGGFTGHHCYCQLLPWIYSYFCRLLPFVAICCLLFEFIAICCHALSCVVIHCHLLPFFVICCHLAFIAIIAIFAIFWHLLRLNVIYCRICIYLNFFFCCHIFQLIVLTGVIYWKFMVIISLPYLQIRSSK